MIGVFIASFAGTTLDSATRVQRYIIAELATKTGFTMISNKWTASGLAVISAAALAFSSGMDGKGALLLWPLFGAVNQLLGGLALLVATVYLAKQYRKRALITGIPCIGVMIMTLWASILNQVQFGNQQSWFIYGLNAIITLLAIIISIEACLVLRRCLLSKKK